MKNTLPGFIALLLLLSIGCKSNKAKDTNPADESFASFENVFLDAYWKEYPSQSIQQGYGKYYDEMVVPDSAAFTHYILPLVLTKNKLATPWQGVIHLPQTA